MDVFLEKQYLRRWWVFMLALAVIVIVVGTAYYATVRAHKDTALVISIISLLIAVPLIIAISKLKLETRIDEKGIFTYFSPFKFTEKFVPWENVENCYVRKYNSVKEFGGWGLRGLGKNWKAYNVGGNKGIQIETKKGKNFLIGTLKPKKAQIIISQFTPKTPL